MSLSEMVITDAYQKLSKARFDHWQANERLFMRRAELQKARAQKVNEGCIDGRNETERDAQARGLLKDQFGAVELAEIEERRTSIAVELCRIEIDRVQTLLRFIAIGQSQTGSVVQS